MNFSELKWTYDEYRLELAEPVLLPAWADFYCEDEGDPEDAGRTRVVIADEAVSSVDDISLVHRAALEYLFANDSTIKDTVIAGMEQLLPRLREDWKEWGFDFGDNIRSAEDLQRALGLVCVYIFSASPQGLPVLGLDFDCAWSADGFKVLLHGTRAVEWDVDDMWSAGADFAAAQ